MNSSFTPLTSNSKSSTPSQTSSFARALLENEQSLSQGGNYSEDSSNHPFSDALAKTGGKLDFDNPSSDKTPEKHQEDLRKQQQKELMRKRLHDQINPTNELFDARKEQVKEEIDKLRQELRLLSKDVVKFEKQVELTLMTEVVDPGLDGKYYIAFFQKLRAFIMLLRQKIKSASTWATQLHTKKSKKKKKGMQIGGMAHEKTSTVQDMMHHERSTQFSGG